MLVCNHQSNFDAPFVFARLPKHIRFVAKQELYRIPIFGAALKAMGNIPVERTGSEGDRRRIEAAIEQVRTRTSILFFAEGTRSTDGRLRSFKKGAAILAIDAQVPVVPVAVAGAHEITPKGGLWVHSGRPLVLRVGKPIPTTGLGREDRDTLTRQAHDAVADSPRGGEPAGTGDADHMSAGKDKEGTRSSASSRCASPRTPGTGCPSAIGRRRR